MEFFFQKMFVTRKNLVFLSLKILKVNHSV